MNSNLGEVLLQMATSVFGEPSYTSNNIVRFKRSKGIAVNLVDGTWFDFTENKGGGVIDFIDTHFPNEKKAEVFKRFGGLDFLVGMWEGIHQQGV
jgi:hypothetical protein